MLCVADIFATVSKINLQSARLLPLYYIKALFYVYPDKEGINQKSINKNYILTSKRRHKYMKVKQQNDVRPKMREHKLRSDVNW
jgi:hypothetical protein